MKKVLALFLAMVMAVSLVACGGETSNENANTLQSEESEAAKNNEPYRGVVYGMSAEDIKTLEKGLSSTFIEGDEERLLYEALVENDIVRVMYLFENEVLVSFRIIANPEFGTKNYLSFYDNLKKTLNVSYETMIVDGSTYWINDYQTIGASTTKSELTTHAMFIFELMESTDKTAQ